MPALCPVSHGKATCSFRAHYSFWEASLAAAIGLDSSVLEGIDRLHNEKRPELVVVDSKGRLRAALSASCVKGEEDLARLRLPIAQYFGIDDREFDPRSLPFAQRLPEDADKGMRSTRASATTDGAGQILATPK